ncbi:MAG: hypothetical protein ACOCVU_05335 [Desulfohalobiaceae bacterium]
MMPLSPPHSLRFDTPKTIAGDLERCQPARRVDQILRYRHTPCLKTRTLVLFLSALLSLSFCPAYGREAGSGWDQSAILQAIEDSPFEEPIHVKSREDGDGMSGEVYAVVEQRFADLVDTLHAPSNWCEILFLHLNVKACVIGESGELIIYSGRKYYQEPEEAKRISLHLRVQETAKDFLSVELGSDSGPYGTRDFQMLAEVAPLDGEQCLLHLQYSLGYGFFTRIALKTYFATLGRNKIGFSVTEPSSNGKPEYVGGVRGMIERNTVRFYYALMAFLENPGDSDEALQARLTRWFELTERHPEQLREIDRDTYLEQKEQERREQEQLANQIEAAPEGSTGGPDPDTSEAWSNPSR